LRGKPVLKQLVRLIHVLVIAACAFIAWGAWQQVVVGLDSHSVVLGYPTALLPLPAFLCTAAIGVMAAIDLVRGKSIDFGHESEVE
jgi:TRAP-type transport system small permease protein